jgi:hypothetical protein
MYLTVLWRKVDFAECMSEQHANLCYVNVHAAQNCNKKDGCHKEKVFWQGNSIKKKYHLVKWSVITKPKKKGGLGVKDLRKINISLLCKWWWKFEKREGMWQDIVRKKYQVKGGIATLKYKPSNSLVWNDLIKIKDLCRYGRVVKIGNGEDTDFWLDAWCGDTALKEKFSDLFEISEEQNISVAAMAGNRWRMTWRRWLNEASQTQLRQLRVILMSCALGSQKDEPV